MQAIIDGEREGYQKLLANRDAEIARLTAERDAAREEIAISRREAQSACDGMDRLQDKIDALTAELAEARAAIKGAAGMYEESEANRSADAFAHEQALAAARRDGAREERALHDDLATAAAALVESLGEYARQSMTANPEWSSGIKQIEAALFARKKRARDEGQGPAITREPAPTANGNRAIWPLLIAETAAGHYGGDTPEKRHLLADMAARHTYGVEHYGTPLQAHNGRDALVDAYQEALDLPAYLRQAQEEGKLPRSNGLVSNAVHLALCIRMHLDVRETEGRGEEQGS